MVSKVQHESLAERTARGVEARVRALPSSHSGWEPASDRPDPVALIEEQNVRRDADLVPVRHGRMMASPFTFYRGAARIMAADLAKTPTAGLEVQLCGDAHLSNFGVFGSPERRMVFDINDFDETLPGPFEYDVKRLAASLTVAARNNGFSKSDTRSITRASVRAYREAMAEFSGMGTLDVWYAHMSEDDIRAAIAPIFAEKGVEKGKVKTKGKKGRAKEKSKSNGKGKGKGTTVMSPKEAAQLERRMEKNTEKARSRNSLQALAKLT